ncbi:AMP-binding protein, partial [Vibrio sp. 10N.261.45.E1]|uniref:AMP-binding protein n=2 Tax=Vibrio TaxID=662 RepID=UPI0013F5A7D5
MCCSEALFLAQRARLNRRRCRRFGCAYIGATPVTTNTRSTSDNMKHFCEVMKPVVAITQPSLHSVVSKACKSGTQLIVAGAEALPSNAEHFASIYSDSPLTVLPADHQRDFAVQFTSGTTSRPKPTLWTNVNAMWGGKSMAFNMRLNQDDITLLYLPLFHANVQITLLSTLWTGGTVVAQPKFSASRFWDACVNHNITWVSMIPFAFKALSGRPVPEHQVRFMVGLERLPEIEQEFGTKTMALWGMTETISACIVSDPDHPGPPGNIGRLSPFYSVEIRKDDGNLATVGEEGQLYIYGERGVTLFKEYYHHPKQTLSSFDECGALNTGDRIRIDEAGWMYYVSRTIDMLRIGSENVAALEVEIETTIVNSGLIMECTVIAQPHDMLGEVPVAFVSLNDAGKQQAPNEVITLMTQYCKEKIADFKVPVTIHITDDFPRSTLYRISNI